MVIDLEETRLIFNMNKTDPIGVIMIGKHIYLLIFGTFLHLLPHFNPFMPNVFSHPYQLDESFFQL